MYLIVALAEKLLCCLGDSGFQLPASAMPAICGICWVEDTCEKAPISLGAASTINRRLAEVSICVWGLTRSLKRMAWLYYLDSTRESPRLGPRCAFSSRSSVFLEEAAVSLFPLGSTATDDYWVGPLEVDWRRLIFGLSISAAIS